MNRVFSWRTALLCLVILGCGCDRAKARRELKSSSVEFSTGAFLRKSGEGDLASVKRFLRAGKSVNEVEDRSGETPLLAAVRGQQVAVAKYLLQRGADPNYWIEPKVFTSGLPLPGWQSGTARPNPGVSALLLAVKANHAELVKLLLDSGADPNLTTDQFPPGPLYLAVSANQRELVQLLLDRGGRTDVRDLHGSTLLHAAPTVEMSQLLVEKGADVNAANSVGRTPIWSAVGRVSVPQIEFYVSKGAQVNVKDRSGMPLIFAAYGAARAALVKAGADLSVRDAAGRTVVQHAASDSRYADTIRSWFALGASLEGLDANQARLLLNEAIEANDLKAAEAAIEKGADVNGYSYPGGTPLSFSIMRKALDITKLLLEKGADPNKMSRYGNTPLRDAVLGDNPEAVASLLKHGADPLMPDQEGKTPLDYARQFNRHSILNLLSVPAERRSAKAGK